MKEKSGNIAQMVSSLLGLLGQCKVHTVLVCTHASTRYQEETQGVSSAWVVRRASDFRANAN